MFPSSILNSLHTLYSPPPGNCPSRAKDDTGEGKVASNVTSPITYYQLVISYTESQRKRNSQHYFNRSGKPSSQINTSRSLHWQRSSYVFKWNYYKQSIEGKYKTLLISERQIRSQQDSRGGNDFILHSLQSWMVRFLTKQMTHFSHLKTSPRIHQSTLEVTPSPLRYLSTPWKETAKSKRKNIWRRNNYYRVPYRSLKRSMNSSHYLITRCLCKTSYDDRYPDFTNKTGKVLIFS